MSKNKPRAELLCIGSELLREKINTNVNIIAENLFSVGISLNKITTIGDNFKEITFALKEAISRADIVVICGGLGPTFDDLTRECISKVLKKPLIFSQAILDRIRKRFDLAGIEMPEENRKQAYLIKNAQPVLNEAGTAPGQIITVGGKSIILLPGPPKELTPMLKKVVCPYLKKKYSRMVSQSLVLHLFGFPESEIDERIKPVIEKKWSDHRVKVDFGILAHHSIIDVKATVEAEKKSKVQKTLKKIKESFYEVLGNDVYGENEETLESVIGKMLKKRGKTLSVAESCTGGLISNKVTNVPGSSLYFKEGVVTYSNESKVRLLSVRKDTLKKFGAVSERTAKEMAKGILKKSGSDWAISVTGIAGPDGGTKKKPVGTVCFAIASHKGEVISYTKNFFGTRTEIKEKSALMSLDLLRQNLLTIS